MNTIPGFRLRPGQSILAMSAYYSAATHIIHSLSEEGGNNAAMCGAPITDWNVITSRAMKVGNPDALMDSEGDMVPLRYVTTCHGCRVAYAAAVATEPTRYHLQPDASPYPEQMPHFFTADGWQLQKPVRVGGSMATTPNLTERINMITEWADRQLGASTGKVVRHATFRFRAGIGTLALRARDASERIHNAEFFEWMVWFARMRYESGMSRPWEWNPEAARLTKLQYNGRAPF